MHSDYFPDDLYIDVNSSDEEIDVFIEQERASFYEEWFEYVADDYE